MKRVFRSLVVGIALFVYSGTSALPGHPQPQTSQDQKETTVYGTPTGKKYHREGCSSLSKSRIPMTLKQAQAKGLTACKVCRPPQ